MPLSVKPMFHCGPFYLTYGQQPLYPEIHSNPFKKAFLRYEIKIESKICAFLFGESCLLIPRCKRDKNEARIQEIKLIWRTPVSNNPVSPTSQHSIYPIRIMSLIFLPSVLLSYTKTIFKIDPTHPTSLSYNRGMEKQGKVAATKPPLIDSWNSKVVE